MAIPSLTTEICFTAGAGEYEASDAFGRADIATGIGSSDSGQTWVNGIGLWGIASGKAYLATDGGVNIAFVRSLANGIVTVTQSTTQDTAGLAFRVQDNGNYWQLRANSTTNYKVELIQDGVVTVMQTIAVAPANGDVLQVTLAGTSITAKVNSTAGSPLTDSTFQDASWAGLVAVSTGGARWVSFSAVFVWTDVSAYVRKFSHKRGRQHEIDKVEIGTANITFASTDRRFEPEYAAGAYYPFVVPMRRVRVTATYNGTSYGRFFGFIERWPVTWPGSGAATEEEITVEAVDPLVIANYGLFVPLEQQVLALFPAVKAYYRLGDSATAPRDFGPNSYDPAVISTPGSSTVTVTKPGLIPALSGDNGALTLTPSGGTPLVTFDQSSGLNVGTGDYSILCAFTTTGNNTFFEAGFTSGSSIIIGLDAPGVAFFADETGAVNKQATGTTLLTDGDLHIFVCVRRSGTIELWVDGVLEDSTTGAIGNHNGASSGYPRLTAGVTATTVDEVCWWERALSADELGLLTSAGGQHGLTGQLSGARLNSIASAIGFDPSRRQIDTGLSTLQGVDLGSITPKEAIDQVVDTEDGLVYIDGDGNLVFRDRNDPWTQVTHDTWGDSSNPADGELHYEDVTPSWDVDRIYNDIRVQRSRGIVATSSDVASQTRYQVHSLSKTVEHDDDVEVQNQADWLLMRYKDPLLRVDSISGKGWVSDPAKVLATDLGDRITVKRRPGGGTAMSFEVIVEHLEETWTEDGDWPFTWLLAAVPNVWILDDPVYSVLDSTTVLGW